MAKIILNNPMSSGNEDEAVRDGYWIRKPNGSLLLTQTLPAAILRHTEELERLSGMAKDGLSKGASVEDGSLGLGEFVEKVSAGYQEKAAAFAEALRKLGVDPDAVWDAAKAALPVKESGPRLRAWAKDMQPKSKKDPSVVDKNEPKGRQVTPVDPSKVFGKIEEAGKDAASL